MTQLLISVKNYEEAMSALDAGADIIDLKDSEKGALGALPLHTIERIVRAVNGQVPTSATVGDWHEDLTGLIAKIRATSNTGVDYIKAEYGKSLHTRKWTNAIAEIKTYGVKLIVMFLVDKYANFSEIESFKALGFSGVMLDTEGKMEHHLLDYLQPTELSQIAMRLKKVGLISGFSGSLRIEHVEILSDIAPDFLGFRGGVCHQFNRQNTLSPSKIEDIRNMLYKNNIYM